MLQTSSNQLPVTTSGLMKFVETAEGRLDILQQIDLQVSSGEAVAILGASGSGKSTLLGLLAGLDEASAGEVRLFDTPLSSLDQVSLRSRDIFYASQA
ncbi:MAG: ATP-binding cassette domain-containing protein [Candidatus Thiodiazotropha sp. (ex Lucinoma borealis)]|nr:ATP-binding cassette domain-containing protein [Candidatus Thiodiazotropha sp. (ex Lucinoma borealis)]